MQYGPEEGRIQCGPKADPKLSHRSAGPGPGEGEVLSLQIQVRGPGCWEEGRGHEDQWFLWGGPQFPSTGGAFGGHHEWKKEESEEQGSCL